MSHVLIDFNITVCLCRGKFIDNGNKKCNPPPILYVIGNNIVNYSFFFIWSKNFPMMHNFCWRKSTNIVNPMIEEMTTEIAVGWEKVESGKQGTLPLSLSPLQSVKNSCEAKVGQVWDKLKIFCHYLNIQKIQKKEERVR